MSRLADLGLEPLPFLRNGDVPPCASTGTPDLFVPSDDNAEGERNSHSGVAQRICSTCPFQSDCLEYALDRPFLEGIWGGTNDEQRRQWRRQLGWVAKHPRAPWMRQGNEDNGDWVIGFRKQQQRRHAS